MHNHAMERAVALQDAATRDVLVVTPTVLVVDDDANVRVELKAGLERAGFRVTVEESGEDVIAAVETLRFDAIVLDKELPDLGGLDLLFFLKHRCPGVPIVLMAEANGSLLRQAARRRGASVCVTKPLRIPALAALLRELIRRPAPSDDVGPCADDVGPHADVGPRADDVGPHAPKDSEPIAPSGAVWLVVLASRTGDLQDASGLLRLNTAEIPLERTVIVGLQRHAARLEATLAGSAAPRLLLQPRNCGTAAEVLLGAYWIHRQDPGATVAVVPADSSIYGDHGLIDLILETSGFVDRYPRWIVLIGAEANAPDAERGWILRDRVLGCMDTRPVWRVDRLLAECGPKTRRAWLTGSPLLATSVFVAKAAELVDAGLSFLPRLHQQLQRAVPFIGTETEKSAIRRAYATLAPASFNEAILEPCTQSLAVAQVTGVTWSADRARRSKLPA